MKKVLVSFLLLASVFAMAQGGFIKGSVVDDKTKEALIGAIVMVKGTENAAFTDVFGAFVLNVEAGNHTVEVMMPPQYNTKTIPNIVVLAGGEKDLGEISMKAGTELTETVIQIQKTTSSESGALQAKKAKVEVAEVMSKAEMTKKGAGDAADAVKSAAGVSIIGGKYVYVRGLGDRYNKTTLNGLELPGLDPDRNAVQMDLFPTNIIGGVSVSKSFVAHMPADFTGGIVDIALKEFPKENGGELSASFAYNPNMHFNNQYLKYDRQSGDLFALGASNREFPLYSTTITNADLMSRFDKTMAPYRQGSLLDYSIGGGYGGVKQLKKGKLGYNVALSYSEKTRYYTDVVQDRFALDQTNSLNTDLTAREARLGEYGTNEVLVSSLIGLGYKRDFSSYTLNAIRIQNGENKSAIFDVQNFIGNWDATQYNLEYVQRTLTNFTMGGKHEFSDSSKWALDWAGSFTLSQMDEPDIRQTRVRTDNPANPYTTEVNWPQRIWREMTQTNYSGKIDLTREYQFKKRVSKLKFGLASTMKEREFAVAAYEVQVQGFDNLDIGTDPNEIFLDQNILGNISAPSNSGFLIPPPSSFASTDPNKFTSASQYFAGYISNEIFITKKLQAVTGLRVEQFTLAYTGYDKSTSSFLIKEEFLNNLDFFPSLGLTYNVSKNQKIRFAGTKTIARPSFKEMSFATIIDPISGTTFNGGLNAFDSWDGNLVSTDIYNADLRWELYMKRAQAVSVSTFYKHFMNPIEMVLIPGAPGNFQPRNVGDGQVFGLEFETKKRLDFLGKAFERFAASFNYTYTISRVERSSIEKESKEENARDGEEIGDFRDMAGQSPYLINGGIEFAGTSLDSNFAQGLVVGLYYNVQGKTLQFVGVTENPDVYLDPFNSLNLTASKRFGKNERYKVSFKASNILADKRESVFVSFNTEDRIFSSLAPMRTFKLGFSMKF